MKSIDEKNPLGNTCLGRVDCVRMNRRTIIIASVALAATFLWLIGGDPLAGPAVLWPSVLAVGLAFLTRDIHLSLFAGAFAGSLLLNGGNPWTGFTSLFTERLLPALSDSWNLSVLIFTLMMGGFVEVLNRNGGMAAIASKVLGKKGGARRVGLGTYALGWVVFFDGLANAMLIGRTLRPLADRARMSREKLAFIVDSTSSPIAGLALLSTWVAYEMSVIREGFSNIGGAAAEESTRSFAWLVESLPFRFYNWFMLLLVFLVIYLMRDFGPMAKAEQQARSQPAKHEIPESGQRSHESVWLAIVPLAVLIFGVIVGLFVDGGGTETSFSFQSLVTALGAADAAKVFVLATAIASLVAMAISAAWNKGSEPSPRVAFFEGMQQMFTPATILVFAWMLNGTIKEMGTAGYLVSLLGERLPAGLLPALVFLLSAVVSFSTGTSWGTMAIMMPLTIPLAAELGGIGLEASSHIMAGSIGAVLAGAVFGDHCSPISDTTVVSAFSSGV